jgi:hypothetical protein
MNKMANATIQYQAYDTRAFRSLLEYLEDFFSAGMKRDKSICTYLIGNGSAVVDLVEQRVTPVGLDEDKRDLIKLFASAERRQR